MVWGSTPLTPNPAGCPSSPPTDAATCPGNTLTCYYCVPDGLVSAGCESMNGALFWNVFYEYHPQPGN